MQGVARTTGKPDELRDDCLLCDRRKFCESDPFVVSQANTVRRGVTDLGSVGSLLLAGFDPQKEPFLLQTLSKYESDELRSIREAKIRIPDAYNLVGVPDPTGSLPAGTICVVINGTALGQSMVR